MQNDSSKLKIFKKGGFAPIVLILAVVVALIGLGGIYYLKYRPLDVRNCMNEQQKGNLEFQPGALSITYADRGEIADILKSYNLEIEDRETKLLERVRVSMIKVPNGSEIKWLCKLRIEKGLDVSLEILLRAQNENPIFRN